MIADYSIDDVFDSSSPYFSGAISFGSSSPGAQNSFTEAISPETLSAGELQGNTTVTDGYLQSSNYVAATTGWRLTPTSGEINFSLSVQQIILGVLGYIRGGQTDYNTGTGFFLGYSGAAYKLSLGNPAGQYLTWDGSTLTINGTFVAIQTLGIFGDGNDGTVDINSGAFSSGPITTNALTRDAYFNNLTLSGGNLDTKGYRIFVKGTLTINSGRKIFSNGGNGVAGGRGTDGVSGGAGGSGAGTGGTAAHSAASLAASLAGVTGGDGGAGVNTAANGNNGNVGTTGTAITHSLTLAAGVAGAAGGDGGNSTARTKGSGAAASTGGSATAPNFTMHTINDILRFLDPADAIWTSFARYGGSAAGGGGSGGGSGASQGASSGGGGQGGGSGAAGGNVAIFAQIIVNAGTIEAKGGTGGNGGDAGTSSSGGTLNVGGSGGGGGGAGGDGGLIYRLYHTLTETGSTSVAGGAGGAGGAKSIGVGTGSDGVNGSTGTTGASGLLIDTII